MTTQTPIPETLSSVDLAALCGVCTRTVLHWQKKKVIPTPTKKHGINHHVVAEVLTALKASGLKLGPTTQFAIEQLTTT